MHFRSTAHVVIVTGSGATQNVGEDYTLTCTVSGGGTTTTTYQWLRNGSPLTGETSNTLSFTPIRQTTPSSNGQYTCQATRSGRTVTSDSFTIAVTCKLQGSSDFCRHLDIACCHSTTVTSRITYWITY